MCGGVPGLPVPSETSAAPGRPCRPHPAREAPPGRRAGGQRPDARQGQGAAERQGGRARPGAKATFLFMDSKARLGLPSLSRKAVPRGPEEAVSADLASAADRVGGSAEIAVLR